MVKPYPDASDEHEVVDPGPEASDAAETAESDEYWVDPSVGGVWLGQNSDGGVADWQAATWPGGAKGSDWLTATEFAALADDDRANVFAEDVELSRDFATRVLAEEPGRFASYVLGLDKSPAEQYDLAELTALTGPDVQDALEFDDLLVTDFAATTAEQSPELAVRFFTEQRERTDAQDPKGALIRRAWRQVAAAEEAREATDGGRAPAVDATEFTAPRFAGVTGQHRPVTKLTLGRTLNG